MSFRGSRPGTARATDATETVPERIGTVYYDPDTKDYVMPPDFIGDEEIRWSKETSPQPQPMDIDDLFDEFRMRLEGLMDCATSDEYSDDQLAAWLREYLWEYTAKLFAVQLTGGAR